MYQVYGLISGNLRYHFYHITHRPPPDADEGEYNLVMSVNGKDVTNKCPGRPKNCIFMVRWYL